PWSRSRSATSPPTSTSAKSRRRTSYWRKSSHRSTLSLLRSSAAPSLSCAPPRRTRSRVPRSQSMAAGPHNSSEKEHRRQSSHLPEGIMVHLNRKKVIGLSLCLGAVAVVAAGWTYAHSAETSTDNAYIRGDVTSLAPKVAGYVTSVEVQDNQAVRAGDVLFRI